METIQPSDRGHTPETKFKFQGMSGTVHIGHCCNRIDPLTQPPKPTSLPEARKQINPRLDKTLAGANRTSGID